MKSKTINPIEIEPETIAEISEDQAEKVEGGGVIGTCYQWSCNTKN
jgi:hypothetical protein